MSATDLNVRHNDQVRTLVIYPGIPIQELQDTLVSTFGLNQEDAVGVTNEDGAVFPLSLVSKAPSYFADGLFHLVTTAAAAAMMGPGPGNEQYPPAPQSASSLAPPLPPSSSFARPPSAAASRRRSVSTIFSLDQIDVERLRDAFELMAPAGVLTREAFASCFASLLRGQSPEDAQRASVVLKRMFNIFDSNDDGVVDAAEFLSGLSVLVGGERDAKIRAAFDMYDYNKDGYISLSEFERYLVSVFTVLRESNPSVFEQENTTPSELAGATAAQCFAEADLNNDGSIDFEEFKRWYSKPSGYRDGISAMETVGTALGLGAGATDTMKDARVITGLDSYQPEYVFEEFAQQAPNGTLDRSAFVACFHNLMLSAGRDPTTNKAKFVLDQLFDAFDVNQDGVVDFPELTSGLTVLCSGSRDDKVRAAFDLYDYNGDGYITMDEITRYLTAVFRVLYKTSKSTRDSLEVSPEELGEVTAAQCFAEADLDQDGRISYEEFRQWYSQPSEMLETVNAVEAMAAAAEASGEYNEDDEDDEDDGSDMDFMAETDQFFEEDEDHEHPHQWMSLTEARRLLGLVFFEPNEVFEEFALQADSQGLLTRESFEQCFFSLMSKSQHITSLQDQNRAHHIIDMLYDAFDTDQNDVIDFSELSAGLSILCGGTSGMRTAAAFALYDLNNDGFISFPEFQSYLLSVFKVMYRVQPSTQSTVGVSVEELAAVTARDAFNEADLNHDNRLSYGEFKLWYESANAGDAGGAGDAGDASDASGVEDSEDDLGPERFALPFTTLDHIKEFTGFKHLSAHQLFAAFEHIVDGRAVDNALFNDFFLRIVVTIHPDIIEDQDRTNMVTEIATRLFETFDCEGDGVIAPSDVKSGLSILCGGGMHDKAAATFSLYDLNDDGYISKSEMITYLTNVFRVMYCVDVLTREQFERITPEMLAMATTEDAFDHNDVDHDNLLSFEEFQHWYAPTTEGTRADTAATAATAATTSDSSISLEEARALTHLPDYPIDEVFELFAEATDDEGLLQRDSFDACFTMLIQNAPDTSSQDPERTLYVIDRLFEMFDADGSGAVDFSELATGLSVLCGGTAEQKAEAAFALYDFNGDGFISLEEMTRYLASVFKVMYETQPGTAERMGVSVEELATVTAQHAFLDADVNHDGRLSYEEFTAWYTRQGDQEDQEDQEESEESEFQESAEESTPGWVNLQEVRRLTALCHYGVEEVFEEFAVAADDEGTFVIVVCHGCV